MLDFTIIGPTKRTRFATTIEFALKKTRDTIICPKLSAVQGRRDLNKKEEFFFFFFHSFLQLLNVLSSPSRQCLVPRSPDIQSSELSQTKKKRENDTATVDSIKQKTKWQRAIYFSFLFPRMEGFLCSLHTDILAFTLVV